MKALAAAPSLWVKTRDNGATRVIPRKRSHFRIMRQNKEIERYREAI